MKLSKSAYTVEYFTAHDSFCSIDKGKDFGVFEFYFHDDLVMHLDANNS